MDRNSRICIRLIRPDLEVLSKVKFLKVLLLLDHFSTQNGSIVQEILAKLLLMHTYQCVYWGTTDLASTNYTILFAITWDRKHKWFLYGLKQLRDSGIWSDSIWKNKRAVSGREHWESISIIWLICSLIWSWCLLRRQWMAGNLSMSRLLKDWPFSGKLRSPILW